MKMDPRVNHRDESKVSHEVHEHDRAARRMTVACTTGKIPRDHAVHGQPPYSRPSEDRFGHDGAADQNPQLHPDHENDRQRSVAKRMFEQHQVQGNPFRLGRAI